MFIHAAIAEAPPTRPSDNKFGNVDVGVSMKTVGATRVWGFNINESIARLIRFKYLKDDWDEEGSPSPSNQSICIALSILMNNKFLMESASVFPSFEGGILIEWRKGGWGYSLLILNNDKIEFIGVEILGSRELDQVIGNIGDLDLLLARIAE